MSGQFKVGEVCIGQNFAFCTYLNGVECTVVGALEMRAGRNVVTGMLETLIQYEVQWADGEITNALPYLLRRKQPPSGEQSVMDLFKFPQPKRMGELA